MFQCVDLRLQSGAFQIGRGEFVVDVHKAIELARDDRIAGILAEDARALRLLPCEDETMVERPARAVGNGEPGERDGANGHARRHSVRLHGNGRAPGLDVVARAAAHLAHGVLQIQLPGPRHVHRVLQVFAHLRVVLRVRAPDQRLQCFIGGGQRVVAQ